MDEMVLRQYSPADKEAVIYLWKTCNLTKPWNNPEQDINRKLKDSPELFLVGTINDIIVASVMVGYDGHRTDGEPRAPHTVARQHCLYHQL